LRPPLTHAVLAATVALLQPSPGGLRDAQILYADGRCDSTC
jgi:hypothetical protein